uniref:ATPase subunit 8 n=1 Tax=Cantacader sp. TaxID=2931283 RepID=A0A8T9ZXR1_9HEMI|nr:ATPase subunit 8 [Cantacader sp.]
MPQMSPMMWTTLSMLTLITIMTLVMTNFFIKNFNFNMKKSNKLNKTINWKW